MADVHDMSMPLASCPQATACMHCEHCTAEAGRSFFTLTTNTLSAGSFVPPEAGVALPPLAGNETLCTVVSLA